MNALSLEMFGDHLDHAVSDKQCVQVWLGHGDALFLGLGGQMMAPPEPTLTRTRRLYLKHLQPPYEFQTYLSDWCLKFGSSIVGSSYDDPDAITSVQALLGLRAVGWEFVHPGWGLNIIFEGNVVLSIIPYKDHEPAGNAWGLRTPDGTHLVVKQGGERYFVHERE